MGDPDYDQVDFLIDNDPIELGRLYRELRVKHQLLQETYERLRQKQMQAIAEVERVSDENLQLREQLTAHSEDMGR